MSVDPLMAAIARLRSGGLVAFPTETVYGLGADALDEACVQRVYSVKGRPARNPLIVHVSEVAMARTVTASWPVAADQLAARFWPGPLSIVLPKAAHVPASVTANGPYVAVRCPDHPLALQLIRRFGKPIVGPSANASGGVSPTTARHVLDSFTPDQVLVLDGGPCEKGIESTVISLGTAVPTVLRPGLISPDELSEVLGVQVACPLADAASVFDPSTSLPSPGLLSRHYAPATTTVMLGATKLGAALAALASPAIVLALHAHVPAPHIRVQMPDAASDYAAALYSSLRNADAARRGLIVIESPPIGTPGRPDRWIWTAIHDRLGRACCPCPSQPPG